MNDADYIILMVACPVDHQRPLKDYLSTQYEVIDVPDLASAENALTHEEVDMVLACHSGAFDALAFLQQLRKAYPNVIRIMDGTLGPAEYVSAVNDAAVYHLFPQNWTLESVDLMVHQALENRKLAYFHRRLCRELKYTDENLSTQIGQMESEKGGKFGQLVYQSAAMEALCETARKAAITDYPLLIQGESGTGKDLLASAIHKHSANRDKPIVVQHCDGMSEDYLYAALFGQQKGTAPDAAKDRRGVLQSAQGGTVLLDGVECLSKRAQIMLLQFLETGQVKPLGADLAVHCNARVIAASSTDIEARVQTGQFDKALFARLNLFQLNMPPLRQRLDDIPLLLEDLVRRICTGSNRHIYSPEANLINRLRGYQWPGNVGELQNELRRLVTLAGESRFLSAEHLSPHIASSQPMSETDMGMNAIQGNTLKEKVAHLEREMVKQALRRNRWNQSKTANELGLSRVGLSNKIKRYGLTEASVNA